MPFSTLVLGEFLTKKEASRLSANSRADSYLKEPATWVFLDAAIRADFSRDFSSCNITAKDITFFV